VLSQLKSTQAQYNLGVMYANDKGVLKDAKQAVYWYHSAKIILRICISLFG
jgi:TPR repeat protein